MHVYGQTLGLVADAYPLPAANFTPLTPIDPLNYSSDASISQILSTTLPQTDATLIQQNQAPNETLLQTALRLIPTLVTANSQRQLLNTQLQRAQQGLPPLDASQYGLGVTVGVSPSTQTALILGVVGIAVIGLLLYRGRR